MGIDDSTGPIVSDFRATAKPPKSRRNAGSESVVRELRARASDGPDICESRGPAAFVEVAHWTREGRLPIGMVSACRSRRDRSECMLQLHIRTPIERSGTSSPPPRGDPRAFMSDLRSSAQ
jgi:hypothetical protein